VRREEAGKQWRTSQEQIFPKVGKSYCSQIRNKSGGKRSNVNLETKITGNSPLQCREEKEMSQRTGFLWSNFWGKGRQKPGVEAILDVRDAKTKGTKRSHRQRKSLGTKEKERVRKIISSAEGIKEGGIGSPMS